MTQTNTIILRIREEEAQEFERLFEAEELPIWKEFVSEGKFLAAYLARVEFGSEETEGVRHYAIVVEVPGMAEHSAHDNDPRFNAFLEKARRLQPQRPLVWGGETLFRVPELPP